MGQHKKGKVVQTPRRTRHKQTSYQNRMAKRAMRWITNVEERKLNFPPPRHIALFLGWNYIQGRQGQVLFTKTGRSR